MGSDQPGPIFLNRLRYPRAYISDRRRRPTEPVVGHGVLSAAAVDLFCSAQVTSESSQPREVPVKRHLTGDSRPILSDMLWGTPGRSQDGCDYQVPARLLLELHPPMERGEEDLPSLQHQV